MCIRDSAITFGWVGRMNLESGTGRTIQPGVTPFGDMKAVMEMLSVFPLINTTGMVDLVQTNIHSSAKKREPL